MEKLKSKIFRKARRWLTAAEHWRVFRMQRRGILPELYLALDQPWFRQMNIATVLDIGAHTGGWARTIHELLPKASICSFEPIPESFETLCRRMADVRNFKAFNIALGAKAGEVQFNRNEFSPSSSLLPVGELCKQVYPFTRATEPITVKMACLDDLLGEIKLKDNLLIKLDVQGYEDQVIAGGRQACARAKIIIVEVAFEPLYEGQPLFGSIHKILENLGFRYAGSLEQDNSPVDGRPLFGDAIFLRDAAQQNNRTTAGRKS